jgi:cytochrome P450
MPLVTELELPALDPSDPTLKGDAFHDALRDAASGGWLATAPLGFVVLDREAASFFLRTKQATFPGLKIAELFGIEDGPLAEEIQRNILHLNGADHSRLRNLVNPAFTPRAAARWRPAMREELERLWAQWGASGRCEVVEDLAKPYPSVVIARVVGAVRADAPRLHHWSNWIQRQFDGPSLMADREKIEQAVAEFYDWAGELIAEHRAHPRDDLVSELVAAEEAGDRLSDVELVNLVLNVFVGGVDTTQSQLAQALRLFAAHPDQWALLADDPALVGRAVDEVVRFEPITPFTARIVEEEIEFRDVTFPVGTVVMVSAWNGNRDGVQAPHAFDITAERGAAKPLTFGAGVHYCLGANLARAELEEALAFLAPRMRDLRLDGDVELGTVQGIYGVDRLPVAFTPAGEG